MTATLARTTPTPAPSTAGEGVLLPLAGDAFRQIRFSSRNIIKVENTFGSHEDFLVEFDRTPVNTLGWVLRACCDDVLTDDDALDLLDGCNWRALKDLVMTAWSKANLPAEDGPDPT